MKARSFRWWWSKQLWPFFCFKQKTAYELRIRDWSSDVCSSDLALGAGFVLASMPVASDAQRADNDIFSTSIALQKDGEAAQAKGDLNGAIDLYESALAADPRHRSAIIAMAQVARAQGLPGKARGPYRYAPLPHPKRKSVA